MPNIVEIASTHGSFNTLVKAVAEAGLVETLQGPGPFTVFAPTDEAFAKIGAGTLDAVLADKEKLTSILTYHVVAGKHTAADIAAMSEVTTVQGGKAPITTDGGPKIAGATITATDIEADNGIIHVIDSVIMPS